MLSIRLISQMVYIINLLIRISRVLTNALFIHKHITKDIIYCFVLNLGSTFSTIPL